MHLVVIYVVAYWLAKCVPFASNFAENLARDQYFTPADVDGWRGWLRAPQPTALDKDLQEVGKRLRSQRDLEWLKSMAEP